ncbi:MAG: ribose-phosphate diphosphokinase [Rubrivivax sp.]
MSRALPPGALLAFDDERPMAEALGRALDVPALYVQRHRFPDGEVKLRLPATLPESVVLLRSLHQPNEKLVELLITAPAARELGARHLQLACPYLAYMRQDIAFTPGEAVSQRHVAALLASRFDRVVTVDPHLHRIASLDEVMPAGCGVALTAAGVVGEWVARHVERPLFLGPDEESAPWVAQAAQAVNPRADHATCTKQRRGDREVEVVLPEGLDCRGRAVVLVDDVASTGRTLAVAARLALQAGARSVDAAVTHGLFVGDALDSLHEAGIGRVWSTDCVPHPTNAISVVPLLARALRAR